MSDIRISHGNRYWDQLGNSYLRQPGNSLKMFMVNLPYWLTKLTNADGSLKQHMQCFWRMDQKNMIFCC